MAFMHIKFIFSNAFTQVEVERLESLYDQLDNTLDRTEAPFLVSPISPSFHLTPPHLSLLSHRHGTVAKMTWVKSKGSKT
ncbi:hypothetical protein BHE90_016393 [Fusarium euwallaceae]|uniref:Uncharacterized protein n=3 Tax=Fusarium solani species complex TaxID=232080 RepID=A0A3M2QUC2_9HYPO|nr:hypothetical protein CDV36_016312 [Fusarium kuroshium]RSL41213.1 hypothetical protein CEP51_016607 [Fusarium floridanum]RTE69229.1 hypothetical protein BHE90_016393 [Fusarium euwallaceae]